MGTATGWAFRLTQSKQIETKLVSEVKPKPKKDIANIPSLGDVGPRMRKQYINYHGKWPDELNLHEWCFLLYDLFYTIHKRMMPHSLVKDAGMMKRVLQMAGDPYMLYHLLGYVVQTVDDITINMLNSGFITGWLADLGITIKTAKARFIMQFIQDPEQLRIFKHLCVMADSDNDEAQKLLNALVKKWEKELGRA